MTGSAASDLAGVTLGEFRLGDLIGSGGMARVYRATQLSLNRTVAVKVLNADLSADAEFIQRFVREARSLAKLQHPNIVGVVFRGEHEGHYYLVMEYVEGPDLKDLLKTKRLSLARKFEIFQEILGGVQYVHSHGIFHRDLKPHNVLMARGQTPKIADFGLVHVEGEGEGLTRSHGGMGTPRYMAPEQWESARSADHRSDLYSLGVMLYQMLCGKVPDAFRPTMPHQMDPGIPVEIDHIIARLLQPNPDDRFQSCDELIREFDQAFQLLGPPGQTVGPSDPTGGKQAPLKPDKGTLPTRSVHEICPSCGREIKEGAQQCEFCGSQLERTCEHCHRPVRHNVSLCPCRVAVRYIRAAKDFMSRRMLPEAMKEARLALEADPDNQSAQYLMRHLVEQRQHKEQVGRHVVKHLATVMLLAVLTLLLGLITYKLVVGVLGN